MRRAVLEGKLEAYNRDVYHSVTKDGSRVCMKLVNADYFEKRVKINLSGLSVGEQAECITLTAEEELVHRPNVNTRERELVVPVSSFQEILRSPEDGEAFLEMTLPADCLRVIVLPLAKGNQ